MARDYIKLDQQVAGELERHFGGSRSFAAQELGMSRQTLWRIDHGQVANLSPKNRAIWEKFVASEARSSKMQRPEWLEGKRLTQDRAALKELRDGARRLGLSTKRRNSTILSYLFANGLDPDDKSVYETAFGYKRKE